MAKLKQPSKKLHSYLEAQEDVGLHSILNLETQPVESFVWSSKTFSFGVPEPAELLTNNLHNRSWNCPGDLLDRDFQTVHIRHAYERSPEASETRAAQHYLKKNGLVLQVLDKFFPDIGPGRGTRQTLLDTEK